MTIRQRGGSFQIDVRTAEGTRIRRDFPTRARAEEAEAALKPDPQQRAAMRKLRRTSSARSHSIPESPKPSTGASAISPLQRLELATSRLSAVISTNPTKATRPFVIPTATAVPSTLNSGAYSGPSGPGQPVSGPSRNSARIDREK